MTTEWYVLRRGRFGVGERAVYRGPSQARALEVYARIEKAMRQGTVRMGERQEEEVWSPRHEQDLAFSSAPMVRTRW